MAITRATLSVGGLPQTRFGGPLYGFNTDIDEVGFFTELGAVPIPDTAQYGGYYNTVEPSYSTWNVPNIIFKPDTIFVTISPSGSTWVVVPIQADPFSFFSTQLPVARFVPTSNASAIYRDLDISFLNNPLSGDLDFVEDESAVSQSVKNLILTSLFERPFQPSLGSIINQLLFAPYDKITRSVLAQTIKETVDKFEPRVELKFVDFYEKKGPNNEPIDDHTLVVSVGFFVLNRPNLVTLSVVLRRLR